MESEAMQCNENVYGVFQWHSESEGYAAAATHNFRGDCRLVGLAAEPTQ